MSRSYRYNADEGGYADRPSWDRSENAYFVDAGMCDSCEETPASPKRTRGKRRAANTYAPMTPEWAIELMKDKVAMTVGALLTQRVIPPYERDDYTQEFNILVCNLLPQYDPERTDENGIGAGVERFLSVAIDNAAKNVKMRVARRRKNIPVVPFIDLNDGGDEGSADESGDGVQCEGNPFKDNRRYMEALWLKMDLEVLSRRLTMEERLTLACRLADFTYQEVAEYVSDRLGVKMLRFHIMENTMVSLRKKAQECGFEPHATCVERGK